PREPRAELRRRLQAEVSFVAAAPCTARSRYRAAEEVRARRLDRRAAEAPRASQAPARHAARRIRLLGRAADGAPADPRVRRISRRERARAPRRPAQARGSASRSADD